MTIQEHQAWIKQFYEERNWYRFNPLIRMNFLTEEMGERDKSSVPVNWAVIILGNIKPLHRSYATISKKNYVTFLTRR